MLPCKLVLSALLTGMFATSALAQGVPTPLPPIRNPRATGNAPSATHPRREPCW